MQAKGSQAQPLDSSTVSARSDVVVAASAPWPPRFLSLRTSLASTLTLATSLMTHPNFMPAAFCSRCRSTVVLPARMEVNERSVLKAMA
jgi:hypothetical protein